MPTRKNSANAKSAPQDESKQTSATLGKPSWKGCLSFGLVNIPIQLYAAVREQTVRFHLLHDKDNVRVQQKLICPVENKEITRHETVRGFEVAKGQHVILEKEELASVSPKSKQNIELISFVEMKEIDPIYFDRPFFVTPEKQGAKAYQLLSAVLADTKKAGIGKFIMRDREYMAAIRPVAGVLCLETMHFANEIVGIKEVLSTLPGAKSTAAELNVARQLVESLKSHFDPEALRSDYRAALMELIEKKASGGEISGQAPTPKQDSGEVIDLMAALEKSLASVKKNKNRKAA